MIKFINGDGKLGGFHSNRKIHFSWLHPSKIAKTENRHVKTKSALLPDDFHQWAEKSDNLPSHIFAMLSPPMELQECITIEPITSPPGKFSLPLFR